jgi:hypothetical protein
MSEPSQHTICVLRYAARQHYSHAVVIGGMRRLRFCIMVYVMNDMLAGRAKAQADSGTAVCVKT